MKLLMIPINDHFNNLINILKLTFISILITNCFFVSGSEQNKLNDFSFDTISKTCNNVEINLTNDVKQGILHSPSYYSKQIGLFNKCKWIINGPANHQLDLTLIDFKQSNTKKSTTCLNKLIIQDDKISNISSLNNIWISLQTNNNSTENRIEFKNNQLNSCDFNLKPFTKIESNLNKLIIEYETNDIDDIEKQEAPFNFLLLISAVNVDTEKIEENDLCNNLDQDLKCNTNYYDPARQHTVCLPKNLVCNCDLFLNQSDYKCYNLVQYINESSLINEKINCYYFLKLNNMCQNQQEFKNSDDNNNDQEVDEIVSNNDRFLVNYEDDSSLVSDKTKLISIVMFKNEKKQIENICINQTLTNEYGWISSPDFGGLKRTYSSGLNCFYHVSFQPNQIVQLRFKYFYLFSNLVELTNDNNKSKRSDSFRTYDLDETAIYLSNHKKFKSADVSSSDIKSKPLPFALGRSLDYDYLNIYDGSTTDAPLIAHLTSIHNDFNRNFNGRVFNSKSNNLLIQFHSTKSQPPPSPLPPTLFNRNESYKIKRNKLEQPQMGFNLTYQIKGLCIEDQTPCNSLYELNCYSRNQTCNDVWDCHNGADERGCGPCKPDQFRCRNHIFCYKLEDRCDGDHQCIDKSDELNCDPWFCNADNGTFLCQNGRCVYEQWVCDGANDCDDGSDEMNCPTPFTRRVITTAVLGGTLCCLLLVMALGCACKLYSLHTVGYRNNIRLTQSVQSAAAVAAAAASVPLITPSYPSSLANPSVSTTMTNLASSFSSTAPQPLQPPSSSAVSEPIVNPTAVDLLTPSATTNNNNNNTSTGSMIYNNLATLFRRALTNSTNNQLPINLENTNNNVLNSGCEIISTQQLNNNQLQPGELPQPHYLIAPPTYNQTMGLVDEYEQRQLAFIEHVRSILLAQQQSNQQQNAGQLINLNTNNNNNTTTSSTNQNGLIPTATSSSTILHRVSNSNGGGSSSGRRSHSSRHHRHSNHQNRSSSNNIEAASVITSQILANNNSSSNNSDALTNTGRISHSRRHHHHHHNHHHRHHRSTNNHALTNAGGFLSTNNNNTNQISNSLSQVNFDSNRRGLIINNQESSNPSLSTAILQSQLQRRRSCGLSSSNSSNFGGGTSSGSSQQQQQLDQLQMQPTGSSQVTSSSEPNSLTTNPTNSFNSTVIKSQSNSINLRDRIAKLIKDIVVHHGDNIQYVPLANGNANSLANTTLTANNNNNNIVESISMTNSPNQSNNQITITTPQTQPQQLPTTTTTQLSTSSNVSQNGSEDDVPLIQPF